MRQLLHLLVLDPDGRNALIAKHRGHWLLPVSSAGERVRTDAALQSWIAEQLMPGDIIGHWLGRVTSDGLGMDWLVATRSRDAGPAADPALDWEPVDALRHTASLIEYQQWAVGMALQHGSPPRVPGPFGTIAWPGEVRAFVSDATGDGNPRIATVFRAGAHEVVIAVESTEGRLYCKGLAPERVGEARLTMTLHALAPESFARTVALKTRMDGSAWWLAAECPGVAATDPCLVADALARTQRRVMASAPVRHQLEAVDLAGASEWIMHLLDAPGHAAVDRAVRHVLRADVPESWVPLDLDPVNVLVSGSGEVRFIDLDDSFFGPAPLAMAVFGRRCRTRGAYETYERAWWPPLKSLDWRSFEIVAAVVEGWLGWQRVRRNTERGEVHGAMELAAPRIAARIQAAVTACE